MVVENTFKHFLAFSRFDMIIESSKYTNYVIFQFEVSVRWVVINDFAVDFNRLITISK